MAICFFYQLRVFYLSIGSFDKIGCQGWGWQEEIVS
jgi:hypothetical protein